MFEKDSTILHYICMYIIPYSGTQWTHKQSLQPNHCLFIYLIQSYLTLIPLAPVISIYDAHHGAYLEGPGGCYIFIGINVKRQSNPPGTAQSMLLSKVHAHFQSPAKLFQNMILKSVHHFGTTAGVIRGLR